MVGHLLEARGEAVGVLRPHGGQGAQDDEVERALQQLDSLFIGHLFIGRLIGHLYLASKCSIPASLLECQVMAVRRRTRAGYNLPR